MLQALLQQQHALLAGSQGPFRYEYVMPVNGMPIWAKLTAVRLGFLHKPFLVVAHEDVSVQRRAEIGLREATANAVRHGKASAISVEPSTADHRLLLDIVDNGQGFKQQGFAAIHHPRSIAERVARAGGDLTITSAPGQTRLAINLPLENVS